MQLAYILAVSFGSVLAGYLIGKIETPFWNERRASAVGTGIKNFAVAVLLPAAAVNSLWGLSFASGKLAVLPFLGVLAILSGALCAVVFIKTFEVEPFRAGSLFTSCMFSNISALAAFVAFSLFGDDGFACIQLFALFEQPLYFAVGFPVSQAISKGVLKEFRFDLKTLTEKPLVFFPLAAVLTGTVLRSSGLGKPEILSNLSRFLVPLITFVFGFSLGLTLKVRAILRYKREILFTHFVKFLLLPLLLLPAAFLSGLPGVSNGLPFKAVAVAAFTPVAFLAVLPPALYGFDVDLANSTWLTTTLSYLLFLPFFVFLL